MKKEEIKILLENTRAPYDYEILEVKKAGIVLRGPEVKSLRAKKGSLKGVYGVINKNNEVFLINFHISPYQPNNVPSDYDPKRAKKLLLNKKEILRLKNLIEQKRLTLIPLKVYNDYTGFIKVDLALAKKRKKYSKKLKIKEREIKRRTEKAKKGEIWG
ncbi:MAG: SsrA-binding protein SmpB [Minisyncoccia bacterium]